MKRFSKILIAVAAVAVIAGMLAPVLEAQCVPARKFASRNLGGADASGERVRCTGWTCETDMSGGNGQAYCANNLGTWIGDPGCPLEAWLKQQAGGPCGSPRRCIDADIGSSACNNPTQGCPFNAGCDLTLFFEDVTPTDDNAGFFVYRVDQTPAAGRTWDYARLQDGAVLLDINPYPTTDVLMSARNAGNVDTNIQYADLTLNYESAGPAMNASSSIAEWDVYQFMGSADPGRTIAGNWMRIAEIPFGDSSTTAPLSVDCSNENVSTFLAVGVTLKDDLGNEFESEYVGQATEVECDPNLADPNRPTSIDQRVRRPNSDTDIRGQRGTGRRGR